jgi:phosphohistidine swiveling domain-containing protein
MEKLRPTVKRNLSLFSCLSWQKGYLLLNDIFNWPYHIIFHFDGEKVNFYHLLTDFNYFKQKITEDLLKDDNLFEELNCKFKKNVEHLRGLLKLVTIESLEEISDVIGQIMSLYIFIVSDEFVKRQPKAWESRKMSEGILYEADDLVLKYLSSLVGKDYIKFVGLLSLNDVNLLAEDKLDWNIVKKRVGGYIIDNSNIITDTTFNKYCEQNKLEDPNSSLGLSIDNLSIIKGQTAYTGITKGRVVLLKNLQDIKKVNKSDVIVSVMTNITYLPAIKKACAIVTDEGGITCHAAIIGRELKKPCIVGTKIATQILKDGDMVEVDADNGIVRIIK